MNLLEYKAAGMTIEEFSKTIMSCADFLGALAKDMNDEKLEPEDKEDALALVALPLIYFMMQRRQLNQHVDAVASQMNARHSAIKGFGVGLE